MSPDDQRPRARASEPPRPHSALLVLMSMDEVASALRTTRKAVYAMLARGQLPSPIRIGRRLLIREQDLLRWLEERRAVSPEHRR